MAFISTAPDLGIDALRFTADALNELYGDPQVNIVFNDQKNSNVTLGLRWKVTYDIAIEAYGSTASSIGDIGQLISAEEVRWGGRFIIKL